MMSPCWRRSEMSRGYSYSLFRKLRWLPLAALLGLLAGCDDPQVYGSVGVSTGYGGYYGGYGGWGQPRMHTSISIGGRIR